MRAYILKRNNQQSGPYSLHQLHGMGLQPTDQVRVAGSDIGWSFVDEIEELAAFVVSSSIVTPNGLVSKNDILNESPISGPPSLRIQPTEDDIPTMKPWSRKQTSEPEPERPHGEEAAKPDNGEGQDDKKVIEVIVTDDHWIFRDGVKMSLSTRKDIRIVGEAENGQQLLNLLKHRKADVILLDITMPVMDGLGALKALRQTDSRTRVIILSMHEGRSMVSTMMEAGANGYLTKTADPESIYQAIRSCHEKGYYFSDLTNVSILEGLRHGAPAAKQQEKNDRPDQMSGYERPQTDEFNGGKILEKLAVSRKLEVKEKPRTSLQVALVLMASLIFLIAGIWGGFWLKAHPEWLRLNTLVPEKQHDTVQATVPVVTPPPVVEIPPTTNNIVVVTDSSSASIVPAAQPTAEQTTVTIPPADKALADKQKLITDRRIAARRAKDSLQKAQQAAALSRSEVKSTGTNDQNVTKQEVSAPVPKKVDISQVISQVSANANNYKVGVFGGLSKIEISVRNGSSVALADVTIEVSYISANDNVIQTKTIHTGPMDASSTQVLPAPSSNRGSRIEWRITQVTPKE